MRISMQEVEHVANLARLSLNEEEKKRYGEQLSAILEHADQLEAVDVSEVEPTSHVLPLVNVLRDDEVDAMLSNEEALKNAPDSDEGQFRVPAVMEG